MIFVIDEHLKRVSIGDGKRPDTPITIGICSTTMKGHTEFIIDFPKDAKVKVNGRQVKSKDTWILISVPNKEGA